VALALSSLVPLLIYDGEWTLTALLVGVNAAYAGFRFGWTCFAPSPRLLAGFFWLFMYIFGGLAPLAQVASHRWPLGTGVPDGPVRVAAVIVLVFVISYDVGTGFARRAGPTRPPRRALKSERIMMIAVFAVITAVYEVYRIGGIGNLFTSRARLGSLIRQDLASAAAPIHAALLGVPTFIAGYLMIAGRKTGQLGQRTLQIMIMVPLALVLTNPFTSSRYVLGTVVLGLALIALQPLSSTLYRCMLLGLGAGLVFAFKVFDRFRYEKPVTSSTVTFDVQSQFQNGDYDAFQQIAHGAEWVASTGYHPEQLLGPPFFWVPRIVWPDKPYDTGIALALFKGFHFTNLSAPIPAELYVAGGVFAVILGGVLMGWLWTRLDRHLELHGPAGWVGLVVPVLAVYQFILLRGSLLQATGRLVVILGLLWFATTPMRRESPGSLTTELATQASGRREN